MYCPNCGANIDEKAEYCVKCGVNVNNAGSSHTAIAEDKPNIWVNILSLCCFPILGIVLYFVWKDKQPKAAKSALTFGLIGFGISIIIGIISFIIGMLDSPYYYY